MIAGSKRAGLTRTVWVWSRRSLPAGGKVRATVYRLSDTNNY